MGLPGFSRTQCGAPAGAGAALTIPPESCTEHNLAGVSLAGLPGFNFDPAKAARPDRARTNRGDSSLEFPFASVRASAQAGALGTLTVAAFMVALIEKLQAASSEPFLQTDPITFNDLQHGTLLIGPRGGAVRNIVLDNPEVTVVVGPPQAGYPVQQVVNSPADMVALLSFSEAANAVYQLGQADPMTTGSTGPTTQHAQTQFFMPDGPPLITLATSGGLPPLPPEQSPNTGNSPFTGGFGSFPGEQPTTLAFAIDENRVVSHDEHEGVPAPGGNSDDTADPFPILLAGIVGAGPDLEVIGRARDGTAADPFVNTVGSVFGTGNIVVTVEASSSPVASNLSVTGGNPIFLFTETTTDGDQVVVEREGTGTAPDPDGAIAFVVYVTEDGQSLWVQQSLPIDHGDDQNDFDSVLSISDAALQLRVTLTDGSTVISQTQDVGHQVVFEDDGPVATADSAQVEAQSVPVDVNALIVLDKSGSMFGEPLSLAKEAILDFAEQPNVRSIRILAFDGSAHDPSEWIDLTQPGALEELADFLDGITASGGTNYQDAIHDVQETWDVPPTIADLTNVYFISDGVASPGLTADDKTEWESFVDENDIENVYAIGINTAVSNTQLQAIAYPNDPDEAHNVIIMDSANDLLETLEATTLAGTASGNVLTNDDFGSDGPGFIGTLSYDSNGALEGGETTYRFDGNDIYLNEVLSEADPTEVTFATSAGGSFTFNFETGAWDYTTPDTFGGEFTESFSYTIVDGDTDISGPAMLNIAVSPPGSEVITFMLQSAQSAPVD